MFSYIYSEFSTVSKVSMSNESCYTGSKDRPNICSDIRYPAWYQDGHHPAFAVYPVPGTNAQNLTNFIFGSSLLKLSLVRRIFARREKIYFKEGWSKCIIYTPVNTCLFGQVIIVNGTELQLKLTEENDPTVANRQGLPAF